MSLRDIAFWLGMVALLAFSFGCFYYADNSACEKTGAIMKMPARFEFGPGCMIEHKPGQWVPLKNYRVL